MAKLITSIWPVMVLDAYASLQDVAANANVMLIGTNRGILPEIDYGARKVSITSANNLAGVQFTIRGFIYNIPVVENIAGPNANTIYSVNDYTSISAITVDNNAAGVSVGTGNSGFLNAVTLNTQISSFGVTTSVNVTNNIDYSVFRMLENANKITPSGNTINPAAGDNEFPYPGRPLNSVADIIGYTNNPIQTVLLKVNGSDITGSLTLRILQNGVS